MQTAIAILAGGQSRRMGWDKAGIMVGGEALLARTARLAREVCTTVSVVGRAAPPDWPLPSVPFLPDAAPAQGPLGGLATALECEGRTVLLVACDLPLLTAEALNWLLRAGQEHAPLADGLVTLNGMQREPLFSLYTPQCRALAQRQLGSGRRSLQALIDAGQFTFADAPPEVQTALRDVDTPEDLRGLV